MGARNQVYLFLPPKDVNIAFSYVLPIDFPILNPAEILSLEFIVIGISET